MKSKTFGSVLIVSVAAIAACTAKDEQPSQKKPNAVAPNLVSLSATEYAIEAPDTIPAGWTTLRMANHGNELHYGHIVRLDSGKTVPELVAAYATAIRTSGPRPKWVQRFGGPGGTAPGDSSSVTQLLEPGSYVWICPVEDDDGNPHFGKGEFKSFVVSAAGPSVMADRGAAPKADMVIRLVDYSFEVDSPLVAGKHIIRVENAGVEPHDLVLMKLAPGKTAADVQRAMNPERARRPGESDDPPPPMETLVTGFDGIATIAPRMQSFFDANITPGEYVMVCMATAPDGRSHIEHGMVRHISVR